MSARESAAGVHYGMTITLPKCSLFSVLQVQDGSFVGKVSFENQPNPGMVAFDQTSSVRWNVANDEPQVATADGGVIGKSGITYDQNGNATGQIGLATQSWRGNMYRLGSVEQIVLPPILAALSLWAQIQGTASANGSAGRPWFFRVTFQNDFTFTPSNPNELTNLTVGISSWTPWIKAKALEALATAYGPRWPVTVYEGLTGGDAWVFVKNNDSEMPPGCGVTPSVRVGHNPGTSEVGYVRDMEEAQFALQLKINDQQDESTALSNKELFAAIGRGIGNVAAHEIAHQFLVFCCTMDANPKIDLNARGTYNATGCNGQVDPSPWTGHWPVPLIQLHWEKPAQDALDQCLSGGWRRFGGNACHK